MYAIIEDSGQQFRVSQGDVLRVDLRDVPEGQEPAKLEFPRVLLVADGANVRVGTPLVEGVKVLAEVLKAKVAGDKLRIFKYKRRKRSRVRKGHRQKYTEVRVTDIVG